MEAKAERLRNLRPADADALKVAIDGAGANFSPNHPKSIARVDNGTVEIGSTAGESYTRLLTLDFTGIAEVYRDYYRRDEIAS